jgi:hypothetical protein
LVRRSAQDSAIENMNDKELTNGQRSVCNDYKLELKVNVRNDNKLKYVRNDIKLQQRGTKVKEERTTVVKAE